MMKTKTMNKMTAMLLAMLLMLTAAMPAMAATYQGAVPVNPTSNTVGSELSFTQRSFYGGQTLAVYRGPGVEYGRCNNGWAKADTDEPLYAAGMENGWALVMYGTSGGSVRVGWVDLSQFKYNTNILKLKEIQFEYKTAKIKSDCVLTDDPVLDNRDLGYLYTGTTVTYLGSFYKYRQWAYIETWMEGRPIRAFVPMDCISVN